MSGRFHIDSFSGALSELPKGKRTVENAVRALSKDPRVSCFERGAPWLERLIGDLLAQRLVAEDPGEPYPWCKFSLTDAGRAMAKDAT